MIITQNDLYSHKLNEAVYLTESEARFTPSMVPVIESNNTYRVEQNYIKRVSESQDCTYLEALDLIKEANGINSVSVVIEESDMILEPRLGTLYEDFYIKQISENSLMFKACQSLLENELIYEDLIDEAFTLNPSRWATEKAWKSWANSTAAQLSNPQDKKSIYNIVDRIVKNRKSMSDDDYNREMKSIGRLTGFDSTPLSRDFERDEKNTYQQARYNKALNGKEPERVKMTTDELRKMTSSPSSSTPAPASSSPSSATKTDAAAPAPTAASTENPADTATKVEQQAKKVENSKDPNIIARAIASFRKLYHNFMARTQSIERRYARMSPSEQNKFKGRKNIFKRIAAKILSVIDRLASKLQYLVDRRKNSEMSNSDLRARKLVGARYNREYKGR